MRLCCDHERGDGMRTGVNIRKRKDGRYEARYPKGRDAAGKLLYGYCYGHSFEEAREKRDRIMAQRPREMNLLILGAGGHGEIIRELAKDYWEKEDLYIPCIDTQKLFDQAAARSCSGDWTADGVHPTPAGHWLLAQEWVRCFKENG